MAMKLRPDFPPNITPRNVCYVCGSAKKPTDTGVIDMDIDIEYEGRLCLCQACIVEAAHQFGLLTKKQGDSLSDQNRRLADKVTDLEARLTMAESLLDAIRRYNAISDTPIDMAGV